MVSTEYLDKIGFSVIRREPGDTSEPAVDQLLIDLIEAARVDMTTKGVPAYIAHDETDPRSRGCVQSYARWQYLTGADADRAMEEYRLQVDDLRKGVIV